MGATSLTVHVDEGESYILQIPFQAPETDWDCYGVEVEVRSRENGTLRLSTAFDVADHWRRAPRYGFLSDFKNEDAGQTEDVATMNKYHLNVVQFYDWMYRHDQLIPPTDEFVDPMGRTLSYRAVKDKIAAVHEHGMAAMAYGAVYAALKDFLQEHPEWGLYKRSGEPFQLIDLFYIMDISPGSPWSEKIVNEFRHAVEEGFDGIHMDQYGFPKKAFKIAGDSREQVDLAECYPALIDQTKRVLAQINPQAGLIFNNVNNYPVHATAKADQDAIYIEVWPPVVHLRELKALIDRGRELGDGKQVILSAYLSPFHADSGVSPEQAENGAILTMATIFASGGYHLLLGEENKVLTHAYYPNYGAMRPSFFAEVRRYYDFIVRYGSLLYDHKLLDVSMTYTGGVNEEVAFAGDARFAPNGDIGTVWTIVKKLPDYDVIHLLNLVALDNDDWERGKERRPKAQYGITCTMLAEKPVKGVYFASPDLASIDPLALEYEEIVHGHGIGIRFTIPELRIWNMVYISY